MDANQIDDLNKFRRVNGQFGNKHHAEAEAMLDVLDVEIPVPLDLPAGYGQQRAYFEVFDEKPSRMDMYFTDYLTSEDGSDISRHLVVEVSDENEPPTVDFYEEDGFGDIPIKDQNAISEFALNAYWRGVGTGLNGGALEEMDAAAEQTANEPIYISTLAEELTNEDDNDMSIQSAINYLMS